MSYVSKSGVVELRRLSETGTLVGDATDLFTIQALYLYDFLSLKNDVNVPVFPIQIRFWAFRIRIRIR
jgi:hypothetical protein